MVEAITSQQFHAADGVADWRVVFDGARTRFRTRSFGTGAALLDVIARLADAADHHPDVDLRYGEVGVRLWTHEVQGLSQRDVDLARNISAAARELRIPAEPGAVQLVQIAIDTQSRAAIMPFWRVVLGYDPVGDEDLVDPFGRGPSFWFQQMAEPREQRNRIHIDISLPQDQAEARIAAALAAGGRIANDANAPKWWTLADPEGNEVDIAPWADSR
jgi:4a-hydroxytetrahydrobiopterin dehydratase